MERMECALTQVVTTHVDVWKATKGRESSVSVSYSKVSDHLKVCLYYADIDECTVMPDLCGENGVCTDTSGNYTCGCLEGYEREGELCVSELFQGAGLQTKLRHAYTIQTLTSAL